MKEIVVIILFQMTKHKFLTKIYFTYYKNFPKLDELKKGIQQFIQAFEYNGSLYPKLKEEKFFKRRIKQSEIDRMMTENQFFKSTVNGIRFFEIK